MKKSLPNYFGNHFAVEGTQISKSPPISDPTSHPPKFLENRMGCFRKGGFSNNRFVLKPDVAIASEVSILSKNSLATTDFHANFAKKTQHVQLFENPLPGTPPFAIPKNLLHIFIGPSNPLSSSGKNAHKIDLLSVGGSGWESE